MSEQVWDDPRITAYVLGELPPAEVVAFEQELAESPELAAAVEEAKSVTEQLGALYTREPESRLDAQRRQQIIDRSAQGRSNGQPDTIAQTDGGNGLAAKQVHRDHDRKYWKRPLLVAAIAATVLILFGWSPMFQRDRNATTVSQLDDASGSPDPTAPLAVESPSSDSLASESLEFRSQRTLEARVEEEEIQGSQSGLAASGTLLGGQKQRRLGESFARDDTMLRQSGRSVATDAEVERESNDLDMDMEMDMDDAFAMTDSADASGTITDGRGANRSVTTRRLQSVDQPAQPQPQSLNKFSESQPQFSAPLAHSTSRPQSGPGSPSESARRSASVSELKRSAVRSTRGRDASELSDGLSDRNVSGLETQMSRSSGLSVVPSPAPEPAAAPAPASASKRDYVVDEASRPQLEAADVEFLDADSDVQVVPELGSIVVRGNRRDVKKVESIVKRLEDGESSFGLSQEAAQASQPSSPAHPSNPAQPISGNEKWGAGAVPGQQLAANQPEAKAIRAGAQVTSEVLAEEFQSGGFGGIAVKQELLGRQAGQAIGGGANIFGRADDSGVGPGSAGDRFEPITENPFKRVSEHPLSTFSIDVDTASYSKVRDYLTRANQLPRPDAVRIEELLNYFDYEYDPPSADDPHPFAARAVITECPWTKEHRLARIALKGKELSEQERPRCNLVFLIDTSGSMNAANKLPLVVEGMQMLLKQLRPDDRVAIVVYAGSAGLVLDSTPAKKRKRIRKALEQLRSGGSTNGGAGIALAYQTARENMIQEGVNRVILCTDGDFNVGATGTDQLVRMVESESKAGIFLTVLGFGMGNHNDAMLEQISGRGNGTYAFIDSRREAQKVLVEQTMGTLVTIAKDVKVQVEFNPRHVAAYRLIGYENRVLAKEDFNDDKKDAGEIGAGHAVTALYELVPAGSEPQPSAPPVDPLKYQKQTVETPQANSNEALTVKLRYKQPDGDTSTLVGFPVVDHEDSFDEAHHDVRFAAAVAGFGMQLRHSRYAGKWTINDVIEVAEANRGEDVFGLRAEFVELAKKAKSLLGQ